MLLCREAATNYTWVSLGGGYMLAKRQLWLLAVVGGIVLVPTRSGALTLAQPGYTAEIYKSLPAFNSYNDMEVDQAGNLYISACFAGVLKVDPLKVVTTWSIAVVCDVTPGDTGPRFGAGRSACNCVMSFDAQGSYSTLHQDSLGWTYVATTNANTLYGNVAVGPGQGLYSIDTSDGHTTMLVAGGPGPGGAGYYFGMAGGADGKLYALGYDGTTLGVFRLGDTGFVLVATLPNGGICLTQGPDGTLLSSVQFNTPSGIILGEIWSIDPTQGTSTLLATSDPTGQPGFDGVAYEATTKTIYAVEGNKIWRIRKDSTPSSKDTWGEIKARYRR
jgi:hypothetical protein